MIRTLGPGNIRLAWQHACFFFFFLVEKKKEGRGIRGGGRTKMVERGLESKKKRNKQVETIQLAIGVAKTDGQDTT